MKFNLWVVLVGWVFFVGVAWYNHATWILPSGEPFEIFCGVTSGLVTIGLLIACMIQEVMK